MCVYVCVCVCVCIEARSQFGLAINGPSDSWLTSQKKECSTVDSSTARHGTARLCKKDQLCVFQFQCLEMPFAAAAAVLPTAVEPFNTSLCVKQQQTSEAASHRTAH